MSTSLLTPDQAGKLLGGRPGLVVGQAISTQEDEVSLTRALRALALDSCSDEDLKGRLSADEDLWELLDVIAEIDFSAYEQFRVKSEHYLRACRPGFAVPKIARVPCSAIVSVCLDGSVENALREHLASKPTQRRVTIVAAPTVLNRPALQLPVYKLFGTCTDSTEGSRVALSKSEFLLRRSEWKSLLIGLADYLRDAGLVFFGTQSRPDVTQEILSTILAGHPPFPNYLMFLEDDPAGTDPVVVRLARGKTLLHRVQATAQEFLDVLLSPAGVQRSFQFDVGPAAAKQEEFHRFRMLAEVVGVVRPSAQLAQRRQEIVEGLFRPGSTRWDAFLFDLDLPRSQKGALLDALLALQARPERRPKFFVLRGEAAVGKTVVAKRLAVDLRRLGHMVLWCKKTNGELIPMYRELARDLRAFQAKNSGIGLFIFWDDPWALGLLPIEFAAALDSEGLDITVTIVTRNSDKATARGAARLPPVDEEIELDFELTKEEEDALPAFLLNVGAAVNLKDAGQIVGTASGRNARDILCRLWYLLPDTREQLEHSLTDEFFRLESVDRLIGSLAESAEASAHTARRAYEAVAVTSGLGFGTPVEVLVNTLRVNYSEWMAMCTRGRPLWGLLYPVEHIERDEYWYLTRNEVVTQILLRQINGGVGHAGEVRVLRSLVEACTGTSPVYRDFLVELLVRGKDRLRKVVTSREGQDLYELALRSFPVQDRTLVHHYAKWVTDEVHDHKLAYEILQKALETADYPYASHEERREFIHTSMAAVIVQRVRRGEQDRESGLLAIKRHLREASTPTFFNLYTVHVQVNALLRLQEGDDPVSLDCFVEACRAIERAQQLAGSQGRRQLRYREALDLLQNQKKELASSLDEFDRLKDHSLERFDLDGDQLPLEAAALKGFIDASLSDKGTDYNNVYQFIRRCQDHVSKKRQQLSPGLRQTRIDLIVRWRLQHDIGEVDWSAFLGDVRVLREEPSKRDDILLLFYEGVACFHLKLAAEAQAAFIRLRSLQVPAPLAGSARLCLRNKQGKPEEVQGVLMKSSGRPRVRLSDFAYDVPTYRDRTPAGAQDGATVHCWVSFSLQGPMAEFQATEPADILLPN